MLLPIGIAVGSHLAGALLGLGGRVRSLGPLRTFALASALAVVLAQLLPEALGEIGVWAILVFLGSLALPSLLGRASAKLGKANGAVGLELGYAGLVVHKIADGVGLGAYGGEHHAGHSHVDIMAALAAHTVPMVAVVAMAYQRRAGWKVAVLRVGGLALAAVFGVYVTTLVPAALYEGVEPWVTACVAGLLLHVLAHDWDIEPRTRAIGERAVDLLAIAGGGAIAFFGGHAHEGGVDLREEIGAALLDLSVRGAPPVFIGLAIAAVAIAASPKIASLRGASLGGRHALSLVEGRGAFGGIALLAAAPALGLETLLATLQLAGWPFALARAGAVIASALAIALAAHRLARLRSAAEPRSDKRALEVFDALVRHAVPWLIVGLVAAAYLRASLEVAHDGLSALLAAIASYASPLAAAPVAAVLLERGADAGAVLGGSVIGVVFSASALVQKAFGGRAAIATIVAGVLVAIAVGFAGAGVALAPPAPGPLDGWSIAPAIVCALVVLRALYRVGLSAWLATLGEAFGGHHHAQVPHEHDHAPHTVPAEA